MCSHAAPKQRLEPAAYVNDTLSSLAPVNFFCSWRTLPTSYKGGLFQAFKSPVSANTFALKGAKVNFRFCVSCNTASNHIFLNTNMSYSCKSTLRSRLVIDELQDRSEKTMSILSHSFFLSFCFLYKL